MPPMLTTCPPHLVDTYRQAYIRGQDVPIVAPQALASPHHPEWEEVIPPRRTRQCLQNI